MLNLDFSSRQGELEQTHPTSSPLRTSNDGDDLSEQTWLDFLQSAEPTAPSPTHPSNLRTASVSSASSGDRKRKITNPDLTEERRGYPYNNLYLNPQYLSGGTSVLDSRSTELHSNISPHVMSRPESGEMNDATLLASHQGESLARIQGQERSSYNRPTAESPELPRWQPDDETNECTVCRTAFGFINRRHHCRKCGRVVCKTCSPHKITIPRPFIVRPPGSETDYIEGGEEVRVCKPCVPDPWVPPPPPQAVPPPPPPNSSRPRPRPPFQQSHPGTREEGVHRPLNLSTQRIDRLQPSEGLPYATARYRSNTHQSRTSGSYAQPPSSSAGRFGSSVPTRISSIQFRHSPNGLPPMDSPLGRQLHQHRLSQGNVAPFIPTLGARPHSRSLVQSPSIPTPPHRQQNRQPVPRPPRREIREEDECPICHLELPPGQSEREQHIIGCIENNTATSTPSSIPNPGPIPPPPLLAQPSSASAPQQSSSSAPAASTNSSTTSTARQRATSHRPSGILVFRATEKDCTDGEGNAQECIICLEEFEQGDEMGRMECWCKFHRMCIRGWWEKKGVGSCPTHQLQE